MTNTVLLVLIGAFIGWNLPQPGWAKWVQAKFLALFDRIKAKFQRKSKPDMKKTKTKTKTKKEEVVPVPSTTARKRPKPY
jgi:hypothetical protein